MDGKPRYSPPVPPLAPAKFTGSLLIAEGSKPSTCEGGVGAGGKAYGIPIPMPAPRQS